MLASATAATAIAPIIPSMRMGDQRLTRLGSGEVTAARGGCVVAGRAVVTESAGVAEAIVDTAGAPAIEGVVVTAGAGAIADAGIAESARVAGGVTAAAVATGIDGGVTAGAVAIRVAGAVTAGVGAIRGP